MKKKKKEKLNHKTKNERSFQWSASNLLNLVTEHCNNIK